MKTLKISLISGAQIFTVSLGGYQYEFKIYWRECTSGAGWYLDAIRRNDSEQILGIAIVPDTDLFERFEYKGFGHLKAVSSGTTKNRFSYDDMGLSMSFEWWE